MMYISEGFAALAASIFYYKYKHLPVRLIAILLWIAVITEIGAYVYSRYIYPNNHWIYNLYSFLFYAILFKMIYDHVIDTKRKWAVGLIAITVILAYTMRGFTTAVFTRFMTNMHNIAMGAIVVALLFYAIDRLKSDAPLQPKKELELFVFGAYLLFGISFVPMSWFLMGQLGVDYSQEFASTLKIIQGIMLISTNVLLVFGFVWTRPSSRVG